MMKDKINKLSKEKLQKIVLTMAELLTEEQCKKLEILVDAGIKECTEPEVVQPVQRMSQELVEEKMKQLKSWMNQIDEGELYLDTEEYEDYSSGYWDREWITEYYDNQGIGDKITYAIRFAKDCVDDRRYTEANDIYEWLWEMNVSTDSEYDEEWVDLELLAEEGIIHTDMEQLALLTLYAAYQAQEPAKRAEEIYLYLSYGPFHKLHIQDMLYAGRENLAGTEQFWKDWIALLQTKRGEVEGRLLQEAVLYCDGIEGLVKMAEENCGMHPSLYLAAMKEYEKKHDYLQIEKTGEAALEKLDSNLKIRSEVALKAAYASSCLMHTEKVMRFCWEAFCSDSTDRNFLRLFGTKEMAKEYGMRGKEVLRSVQKGDCMDAGRNAELRQNWIGNVDYYTLSFYMGDFDTAKGACRNPEGSLGWSGTFMPYGIRLFLLYLYEEPLPSKAAGNIADYVGFRDETDLSRTMGFENEIIEESRRDKTSTFWNYFKKWKQYFPMSPEEKKKCLAWAEKIVYSRADAIVSGQHRGHYGAAAILLAMVAEIKECMGVKGAKQEIFAEYKRKFPRHSSFQTEMKNYFNAWKGIF